MSKTQQLADLLAGSQNADTKVSVSAPMDKPYYQANFDTQFLTKYFSQAASVYTPITDPENLDNSLKTKLFAFLFGNSDSKAGYADARGRVKLSVWEIGDSFIFGRDVARDGFNNSLPISVTAQFQVGDMITPYTATAGGTDYAAYVIIRVANIAYGSLLGAIDSDQFSMNMLRYVLNSTSDLAQYAEQIELVNLSLFGKQGSDTISPNSFKKPENQQETIIDMTYNLHINKETMIVVPILYNVVNFSWSIFVSTVEKLSN